MSVRDASMQVIVDSETIRVVRAGEQGPAGPPSLSPDGVITTEGDLIIGGSGGTPTTLTVGDPGTFPGTADGVSITNLRPGRIDARVRGLSTADSDGSTLFDSLLSESGTDGSELWIPEGTYRVAGNLTDNARVGGRGTLKLPTGSGNYAVFLADGKDNIEITGITIDGNAAKGGVLIGDNCTNVKVHHTTIQNTGSADVQEGVRVQTGSTGVRIHHNVFACNRPVLLYNANDTQVTENEMHDPVYNGVTVWALTPGTVMHGVVVAWNVMTGCNRMGVEVYADSTSRYYMAPKIEDNTISFAETPSALSSAFGISTPGARGVEVHHNEVRYTGSGTLMTYGLEIIGERPNVSENYVVGMQNGIFFNDAPYGRVHNNHIENCYTGIATYYDSPQSLLQDVIGNRIFNPRDYGIDLYPSFGGQNINDNLILRSTSWSGDSTRTFVAIQLRASTAPSQLHRNRIVQGMTAPTSGLAFRGIQASIGALGDLEKTALVDNMFIDLKTGGAMMTPLYPNAGAPSAADIVLSRNTLTNASGTITDVTSW